jgi:hypothetical protein
MLLASSDDVSSVEISSCRVEDHVDLEARSGPPVGTAPRRANRRLALLSAPVPQGHARHRSLAAIRSLIAGGGRSGPSGRSSAGPEQ